MMFVFQVGARTIAQKLSAPKFAANIRETRLRNNRQIYFGVAVTSALHTDPPIAGSQQRVDIINFQTEQSEQSNAWKGGLCPLLAITKCPRLCATIGGIQGPKLRFAIGRRANV
jgi:hypothetical protein